MSTRCAAILQSAHVVDDARGDCRDAADARGAGRCRRAARSRWLAAALALAFIYCQARMLQAAKGIPAWREPLLVPLMVVTGLAEGARPVSARCSRCTHEPAAAAGRFGALVLGGGCSGSSIGGASRRTRAARIGRARRGGALAAARRFAALPLPLLALARAASLAVLRRAAARARPVADRGRRARGSSSRWSRVPDSTRASRSRICRCAACGVERQGRCHGRNDDSGSRHRQRERGQPLSAPRAGDDAARRLAALQLERLRASVRNA